MDEPTRKRFDSSTVMLGVGVLVLAGSVVVLAMVIMGRFSARPPTPVTAAARSPDAANGIASTIPSTTTVALPITSESDYSPPTSMRSENDGLSYELVAEGLTQPVAAALVPGTADAFYVVERFGRVVYVADGGVFEALDIANRVTTEGNEQGLVGIALHPDFDTNGRAFLSYVSAAGPLRIVEVHRKDGSHVLSSNELLILGVEQPAIIHHGGTLQFGPDGMLWIGLGDGGIQDDSVGNAQNPFALQGSLLRIDIDMQTDEQPYGIPPGNPFDGEDGAPEVWAYGLRNPWRFSFDGNVVYIADVGQQRWEEINLAPLDEPGLNFGWSAKHGPDCYWMEHCEGLDSVDPAVAIPYDGLCAVIGGPVYRGSLIPMLWGQLLWADYCNGFVASISFDGDDPVITRWSGLEPKNLITSFVEDAAGEVYIIQQAGNIYKIVWNAEAVTN